MGLPTVTIIGNVKRPELKYSQSGKAVHKFTLECSEKKKDGEWDNLYIEVVTFEKSAEFVNQYFTEGSLAVVTGKLVTKVWANAEGKKQYDIALKFPTVEFAPKDKSSGQNQEPQYQQAPQQNHTAYQPKPQPQQNNYGKQQSWPAQPDAIDEDEIPF